ncbi:MAG: ATP-binding protein [Bdellovibrionaceae bacterium]|nr:ATP-binding protein [Pseudobdellovibrionaceae bacterium]
MLKVDKSFIKLCEKLLSSVDVSDFLLNLQKQISKKYKTRELILFYKSEQLGLRRAYVKNGLFYESLAKESWPLVKKLRLSSPQENLYLAKEFGRPFFTSLMIPLDTLDLKSLLILEIYSEKLLKSLISFFEERKDILEISFKRACLNTHFSRISYLWSQLFVCWREPLVILNDFQVLLGNDSFKKNFSNSIKSFKKAVRLSVLKQKEKTYKLRYYPLKNSKGILYCQDMTRSFILKEQLFQSEKKSLLFHLGQNMAHQLNNPLTGVKGMSQILKEKPILRQFKEEFIELEKAIKRSQKIIESFLSFSQKNEKLTKCDVNCIIQDTLPLLKKSTQGIKLDIKFCKEKLLIRGNFALLQQVFYNLILNASQALAEDKKNKNPLIQIRSYFISEDEICVKIKDNGIGIQSENLEKIFKAFWTNKKRGTGFGLSVAKKIIQKNHGKIFISSKKNHFTCFTLIFPRYESMEIYKSYQSSQDLCL